MICDPRNGFPVYGMMMVYILDPMLGDAAICWTAKEFWFQGPDGIAKFKAVGTQLVPC